MTGSAGHEELTIVHDNLGSVELILKRPNTESLQDGDMSKSSEFCSIVSLLVI